MGGTRVTAAGASRFSRVSRVSPPKAERLPGARVSPPKRERLPGRRASVSRPKGERLTRSASDGASDAQRFAPRRGPPPPAGGRAGGMRGGWVGNADDRGMGGRRNGAAPLDWEGRPAPCGGRPAAPDVADIYRVGLLIDPNLQWHPRPGQQAPESAQSSRSYHERTARPPYCGSLALRCFRALRGQWHD
jgi:hypothetical protein